ncbi:MAG: anthranilate synthase component I [Caldithrix sp.]|nr:anthranilate synthase component I [Caldithrix sp.]
MTFKEFKKLAAVHNIIPVYEKITADLLTPVLAYLKIREKNNYCFLLESVEGIGRFARYSFIGKNPSKIFYNAGHDLTIIENGNKNLVQKNIFHYLKNEVDAFNAPSLSELPDFTGGLVGYLGYENISQIEDVISFSDQNQLNSADSFFGAFDDIIAFDHYTHHIILISNTRIKKNYSLQKLFNKAQEKLQQMKTELRRPLNLKIQFRLDSNSKHDDNPAKFFDVVEKAKQNIYNGDVFQIVLSRRFSSRYDGDLLNVYRALRMINPSPYMYFMEFFDDFRIIGTSPEDLLSVKDDVATILPIAGTRKRGNTAASDQAMERELLNDPKERAEHVMLVDLARNDLGKVSQFNSVRITADMEVRRYSHVMHIVSRVEGTLKKDKNCVDALMAAFPAGTLTGAPKIRAIQLIEDYEHIRRNVYGGAVGYMDYNQNLDMCIAIRTLFADKNMVYWQAGAGIVADSDATLEYKEINNKSAVMRSALRYAEQLDEDFSYR